jgi:YD repeat-containing protein
MRNGFAMIILAAVAILAPAARAYPADSLLLVRMVSTAAAGDTLSDERYAYSQDDHGFWYESRSTYRADSLAGTRIKTYDARGLAVAETSSTRTATGVLHLSVRTEYDTAGLPIDAVLRYNDSLTIRYGYRYDLSGKLLKWTLTGDPSDPVPLTAASEYAYAYDAQGRLRSRTYAVGGVFKGSTAYAYDSAGRLASEVSLEANGDTSYAKAFAYDGAGRVSREILAAGKDTLGLLYTDERTEYDAQGNVKAKTRYGKAGFLESMDEYAYARVRIPVSLPAFRKRPAFMVYGNPAPGRSRDILGRGLDPRKGADRMAFPALPPGMAR